MSEQHGANPEMIVLGRKSRGKTQRALAAEVGFSQSLLAKYEAGSRSVSNEHLALLCESLDYPQGFFTRLVKVEGAGRSEVFHRKRSKVPASVMDRAYALAQIRRLEIGRMLDAVPPLPLVPSYPVDEFDDDPEKIARTVRAFWQLPSGPVFNMTRTLEQNGCMIAAHNFGSRHIDGFSHRSTTGPPFFHVNSKLPPDRWRWTLAHELGHAVMHFEPGDSPKLVEEQADRFAAEFLAPGHELLPLLFRLNYQKLAALKREWKISMQALVMRAYHLGAIDARQKTDMFTRLSRAGYRLREPEALDPPVEKPELLFRLVQIFEQDLEFSQSELRGMLHIGEADFRACYSDPSDILGEILHSGPNQVDGSGGGYMNDQINSLDLGPSSRPLHLQIGCHPEDVIEFQRSLDSLHLLERERLIPQGIIAVGEERVRDRLSRKFAFSRPSSGSAGLIEDLPF